MGRGNGEENGRNEAPLHATEETDACGAAMRGSVRLLGSWIGERLVLARIARSCSAFGSWRCTGSDGAVGVQGLRAWRFGARGRGSERVLGLHGSILARVGASGRRGARGAGEVGGSRRGCRGRERNVRGRRESGWRLSSEEEGDPGGGYKKRRASARLGRWAWWAVGLG
jgi:hypothetical protein